MTAKELLRTALEEIGADGLCNEQYECGCRNDNLLIYECLWEGCVSAIVKGNVLVPMKKKPRRAI